MWFFISFFFAAISGLVSSVNVVMGTYRVFVLIVQPARESVIVFRGVGNATWQPYEQTCAGIRN